MDGKNALMLLSEIRDLLKVLFGPAIARAHQNAHCGPFDLPRFYTGARDVDSCAVWDRSW